MSINILLKNYAKHVTVKLFTNRFEIELTERDGSKKTMTATPEKPFSNQRILIADFEQAEKCLIKAFKELHVKHTIFGIPPIVDVITQEKNEGGLSMVEHRAIFELAERAGSVHTSVDGNSSPFLKHPN